jgi:hypothetical protein
MRPKNLLPPVPQKFKLFKLFRFFKPFERFATFIPSAGAAWRRPTILRGRGQLVRTRHAAPRLWPKKDLAIMAVTTCLDLSGFTWN